MLKLGEKYKNSKMSWKSLKLLKYGKEISKIVAYVENL